MTSTENRFHFPIRNSKIKLSLCKSWEAGVRIAWMKRNFSTTFIKNTIRKDWKLLDWHTNVRATRQLQMQTFGDYATILMLIIRCSTPELSLIHISEPTRQAE